LVKFAVVVNFNKNEEQGSLLCVVWHSLNKSYL